VLQFQIVYKIFQIWLGVVRLPVDLTEKVAGAGSSTSGVLSFLGGYTICHNICLGLIAGLSLVGISVTGMPLEFLQPYAIPLWSLAVVLLGVSAFLYFRKKCISQHLLVANTGLLIAATPFPELAFLQWVFWIFGFGLLAVAVYNYLVEKKKKKVNQKWCPM
jgi:hypothetical protein